jgi:hypothetical protein
MEHPILLSSSHPLNYMYSHFHKTETRKTGLEILVIFLEVEDDTPASSNPSKMRSELTQIMIFIEY